MSEIKNVLFFCLLLFACLASSSVYAEEADDMKEMEEIAKKLEQVTKKLDRGQFEGNDLNAWTKLGINMKSKASLCVSNIEAALVDMETLITGLGEKVKGEDVEVTKKRKTYQKDKEELDKKLAKCNLYVAHSNELASLITKAEKYYFKQKYLARTPHMLELVEAYVQNPAEIFLDSGDYIYGNSGISEIRPLDAILSIFAVVVAIYIGIWTHKKLMRLESKRQWQNDFLEKISRALLTTLSHMLPYLLGSATATIASVIITEDVKATPFVTEFFLSMLVFYLVITVIRLLLSPYPPAQLFIAFTPHIASALSRRLKVLAILGLIGYLAFYSVYAESINEASLMLMRNIFSLFFVVNFVWTLQVITSSPKLPKLRVISIVVIIAVLASLVAEWMGYRNLAFSGRRLVVISFIVFMTFIVIAKIFRDLFNAIDEGTYPWCRRIHKALGVSDNGRVPGLIWIRFLTSVAIWGTFGFLFINAWDYSGTVLETLRSYIVHGFDIGEFRIIPSRVLWALLIFSSIIIFSSWMRSQMENNWLKMTNMGLGARDAMVKIIGYIMFIVALFAGLAAIGFDFGNIAIVAGALSVGIGFGLQNIVNNFVSGLVLLFERPIRKGDWVVVGTTEGYVKEIQIRSTKIQTFDRSDVIVPNSELISNQVTNWVLSNKNGRAVIRVGVAYGSDTEKVRNILLAVADENTNVVKSGEAPDPIVLFREFGDSSLNFELRVFLYNIDNRLSVISELNFAIDRAFREAGIEIPFPQRDLHVKTLPDNFLKNTNQGENDVV